MEVRSRNLSLLNRPESDAVLKCVVRGYPPPTVEWFRLPRRRGVRREKMIQLEQGTLSVTTIRCIMLLQKYHFVLLVSWYIVII